MPFVSSPAVIRFSSVVDGNPRVITPSQMGPWMMGLSLGAGVVGSGSYSHASSMSSEVYFDDWNHPDDCPECVIFFSRAVIIITIWLWSVAPRLLFVQSHKLHHPIDNRFGFGKFWKRLYDNLPLLSEFENNFDPEASLPRYHALIEVSTLSFTITVLAEGVGSLPFGFLVGSVWILLQLTHDRPVQVDPNGMEICSFVICQHMTVQLRYRKGLPSPNSQDKCNLPD